MTDSPPQYPDLQQLCHPGEKPRLAAAREASRAMNTSYILEHNS